MCGAIISSTCAAKRPATRILSCSSGVLIVIMSRSCYEAAVGRFGRQNGAARADSTLFAARGLWYKARASEANHHRGNFTHAPNYCGRGAPATGSFAETRGGPTPKGAFHGRRHYAPDAGSGCAFRAPNPFLESQDG